MAAYSALFQQQIKTSGEGKCPKGKSHLRYNIKKCNVHKCQGDEVCIAMQDLVISIDGSGSLTENRFKIMEAFMLVKFCPEAISPSTRKVKEGEMGYMLVRENGHCGTRGVKLSGKVIHSSAGSAARSEWPAGPASAGLAPACTSTCISTHP